MQNELIQFGAVTASRARRSAAGFSRPTRSARMMAHNAKSAPALDAAFADFTGIDAEQAALAGCNSTPTTSTPALAATLIASITTQLEALDSQRRQLERLLGSADATA